MNGVIYAVESGRGGPVKIGFTSGRLEARVAELQTGNPDRLVILAWGLGSQDDERGLHVFFEDSRIHGEWFRRTPEIETLVRRLNSGFSHGLPQFVGRPVAVVDVVLAMCGTTAEGA